MKPIKMCTAVNDRSHETTHSDTQQVTECEDLMDDPAMMESLKNAAKDLTADMMPVEMWDNLEVMAESLGAFMEDPSNMDALMPFLEQVEEVGMNMDIMQTNMLKSMGYNDTEELMQDMRKQIEDETGIDVVAVMGGEETQEGPYYNSDTLDDGRIIAPGNAENEGGEGSSGSNVSSTTTTTMATTTSDGAILWNAGNFCQTALMLLCSSYVLFH